MSDNNAQTLNELYITNRQELKNRGVARTSASRYGREQIIKRFDTFFSKFNMPISISIPNDFKFNSNIVGNLNLTNTKKT